jgi:hypothetical protein
VELDDNSVLPTQPCYPPQIGKLKPA